MQRNPKDFRTIDGVVYLIRTFVHDGKVQERLFTYVPEKLYALVVSEYHMPPMAGHGGIKKTYESLKEIFYFPKMKAYVEQYV